METLLDDAFGGAEHDGDVLERMEAVGNEEGGDDNRFDSGEFIAIGDAGLLLHEDGVDLGVKVAGGDEFHLAFDGLAGVFGVAGAVAGDEKGRLGGFGGAWEREFFDNLRGGSEEDVGHAGMSSDRAAVIEGLGAAALDAVELSLLFGTEAEFARNDFLGEVALADEERNNKNARGEDAAQDLGKVRLLFPECFLHLGEKAATAEFIGMAPGGEGGIGVEGGTVCGENEGGVGEIVGGCRVGRRGLSWVWL